MLINLLNQFLENGQRELWVYQLFKYFINTSCSASFPTASLRSLQVLPRPLSDYVSLLLTEVNDDVRGACEKLVVKALAHEHRSVERRTLPTLFSSLNFTSCCQVGFSKN